MQKFIVYIIGTTAAGKTKLSLSLGAEQFEILSCDSMQLYKKANVMTAKATPAQQQLIRHHGIDILELGQAGYHRGDWQTFAFETIKDIQSRNKTPVLVGGTHYYIESVLFEQKEEAHYYFQGEIDLKGMTAYDYLNSLDPLQAQKYHRNDERRILNSIKYYLGTGKLPSTQQDHHSDESKLRDANFLILWPKWKSKEALASQVRKRVNEMLYEEGGAREILTIFGELDGVEITKGGVLQSIGYRQFRKCYEYFKQTQRSIDEVLEQDEFKSQLNIGMEELIKDTLAYTKKQLQWIKNRILGNKNLGLIANRMFIFEFEKASEFESLVITPAREVLSQFLKLSAEDKLKEEDLQISDFGLKPLDPEVYEKYQILQGQKSRENWKKGMCELCGKEFNGPVEQQQHLKSKMHKKQMKKTAKATKKQQKQLGPDQLQL